MNGSKSQKAIRALAPGLAIAGTLLASFASDRAKPVAYSDVTSSSGIHFKNSNSATPEKYLIETMTGGVAIFDYDNDGWPDVFLVNGAKIHAGQRNGEAPDKSAPEFWNRLYRNNHDGTFTDVTEKAGVRGSGFGMGAAVGDFNNDGFEDLLVTNFGGVILSQQRQWHVYGRNAKIGAADGGMDIERRFFRL